MARGFTVVQFPNPPLLAGMAAAALARLTGGPVRRYASLLSRLALLLWAYEEVVAGVNLFRRLLGAAVGARMLSELARLRLRGSAQPS